jgi:hypothetical protein
MAKEDEVMVQLATRIPKDLHRQVRVLCVHQDVTQMGFVIEALTEKLARERQRRRARSA